MSKPWVGIVIDDGEVSYNGNGKPLWRRCNWCGADAVFTVTRTSALSDRVYCDYACDRCAKGWESPETTDLRRGNNAVPRL